MRLLLSILLIFCIFSVADGSFFDDIVQYYEDFGEDNCEPINRDRVRAQDEITWFQKIWFGFFDGFLDCEHRGTSVDGSGVDMFAGTLWGTSGKVGILLRRVFNLRQ